MIKEGGGTDARGVEDRIGGDQTATPPQLIIVQHWGEELKRLVPSK